MATRKAPSSHSFRAKLAAESVDQSAGVIKSATVARAGVQATGKVVFLDANGAITRDEKLAKKRLPVFTDEKTLATLMSAAAAAGTRVKSREDHNDAIEARAGFTDTFKLTTDGRVVADVHLFKSYRNREIVLETARETPEEMGLSIDFDPEFEIQGDRALMRVAALHAVDVVDEGAITHGGFFLSAGEVDTAPTVEDPNQKKTMPPTIEELMTQVGALAKSMQECQAAVQKMATPPAPAADPKAAEALAAVGEIKVQMGALITTVSNMRRENAALGYRGTPSERAQLAKGTATAEDIEKLNGERKTYLQLVADAQATMKLKAGDAHRHVQKTDAGALAYRLHLDGKGVARQTA